MRMADIIEHKKQGLALTKEEIDFFVKEYTNGDIPDYQASALAMAIYFKKMTNEETAALTLAMAKSGDMLDLSEFKNSTVDKHSSGGVGDKTTLVVAPIAAAAGCTVAKMSGRGLGFTGGTIDKLEAIPFAADYAQAMGRAFQIVDDILDVTGTFEELGKPIGSDSEQHKNTYVSLLGLDKSEQIAKQLTVQALGHLKYFEDSVFLTELTSDMLTRRS